MTSHLKKNDLSDTVSLIADEINMHRAIDAMELQQDTEITNYIENKIKHVYYISAASDVFKEKAHIQRILERKNRSVETSILSGISAERPMTVIFLWDHSYKDQPRCYSEFNKIIEKSRHYLSHLRVVIILLDPDIVLPDNIPAATICLPGFDRVSRELTIFKIVQEE